jgi:hypothetical protein
MPNPNLILWGEFCLPAHPLFFWVLIFYNYFLFSIAWIMITSEIQDTNSKNTTKFKRMSNKKYYKYQDFILTFDL